MALKKNLDMLVFEKIRDRIIASEWEQGENLDVDELAHYYEVSRTPVLQALKRMLNEGMLVVSGTGKYFFPKYTKKDVQNICRVRRVLELEALDELQNQPKNFRSSALLETAQRCKKMTLCGNIIVSRQLDLLWHKNLIELTGNDCLIHLYTQVQGQFMVANYLQVFHSKEQQLIASDDHIHILERLEDNDYLGAKEILLNHIDGAYEKIVARIYESSPST